MSKICAYNQKQTESQKMLYRQKRVIGYDFEEDKQMERKMIFFGSLESALSFLETSVRMPGTLKLVRGEKSVDAKSLLGVFSMDLSEPMELEVQGDEASRNKIWDALGAYLLHA